MRRLLLDLPAKKPALGFGDTAEALAQIIEQSDPQFAVGIFGGWGSGKTTLMDSIRTQLVSPDIVTVEFSPWRYEKEEHLIVPLLDTVREQLVELSAGDPQARKVATTLGKVMRSIIAGMSVKIGVPGAIDLSFDANKALADHDAPEDDEVPGSFYHASFRALKRAFEGYVGEEGAPAKRIVVFVDDLDRCLPESALQVLESMKLFFDLRGFVFVVGLDQDVVEHVIDAKYGRRSAEDEEDTEVRVSGAEYIKKIFQLPYRLAPVSVDQLEDFLEAAYEEAGLDEDQRVELRQGVAPHLRFLVGEGAVNPREIKRYINAYTLLVAVDREGRLDPQAVLALQTIAFREDWERVQDALLQFRDLFTRALRRQIDGEANALGDVDPELQAMPDDVIDYFSPGAPGRALLEVDALAPYLTSGEATRSTQDPRMLSALTAAGSIRRLLRQAATGAQPLPAVAAEAANAIPVVERAVGHPTGPGQTVLSGRVRELQESIRPYAGSDPEKFESREAEQAVAAALEEQAREIARRLLRLYRQGSVAAAATA